MRSAAYLELGRDAGRVVLEGGAGWLVQSANTDATAGAKAQILTLLARLQAKGPAPVHLVVQGGLYITKILALLVQKYKY